MKVTALILIGLVTVGGVVGTESPTLGPSLAPSLSPSLAPSLSPSLSPSEAPTLSPTESPTEAPTKGPTRSPSGSPTKSPTLAPIELALSAAKPLDYLLANDGKCLNGVTSMECDELQLSLEKLYFWKTQPCLQYHVAGTNVTEWDTASISATYCLAFESEYSCAEPLPIEGKSSGSFTFRIPVSMIDETGLYVVKTVITTAGNEAISKSVFVEVRSPPVEFVSEWAKTVGWVFGFAMFATGIGLFIWTFIYRKNRLVLYTQPHYLLMIILGSIICSVSMFFSSIAASWACQGTIWFYSCGFSIAIGVLVAKTWRVAKVFNLGFRRASISSRKALLYVAFYVFMTNVLLSVWTLFDPLQYKETIAQSSVNATYEIRGTCESSSQWVFLGLITALHLIVLLFGVKCAYETYQLHSMVSDSVNVMLIFAFCIVLNVTMNLSFRPTMNHGSSYLLRICSIFVTNLSILLLLFTHKMAHVHVWKTDSHRLTQVSTTSTFRESFSTTDSRRLGTLTERNGTMTERVSL